MENNFPLLSVLRLTAFPVLSPSKGPLRSVMIQPQMSESLYIGA